MNNTIKGCIEVLRQGERFLNSVSDEAYVKIVEPFFISSSGEHMRHIINHFSAIKNGYVNGAINYDQRERGSEIETHKSLALQRLNEIIEWISNLDETSLKRQLQVKTEVALSEPLVSNVTSTLARELVFSASHAIHHYSTIATSILMQDLEVDKEFGIAPATASYFRTRDNSCVPSPG